MSILRIKNSNGEWVEVPAIKGSDGKSAYEYAQQGGYVGTEDDFIEDLGKLSENTGLNIVVDTELSTTSTNPVQNKVINTALENKVDKISGKTLSTNDYTTDEKNKLNGIDDGANKTIVDSEWSSTSTNPLQNKVIYSSLMGQQDTLLNHQTSITYLTNNSALKDLSNVTYPANTAGTTTIGAGDRVVNTYISSDGKTFFRLWASGWKECGTVATPNASNYQFVFPFEFTGDRTFTVVANCYTNGYISACRIVADYTNKSQVDMHFGNDSAYRNAQWVWIYACGY